MKSTKGHQEEEEDYEDFGAKKDNPPCSKSNRDGKSRGDKASATRSKHSVTEQRRRSKINERFQILRDLIPNSDQKRDTASFLLEVIEYVRYLQEKVQKYEGSYPSWSMEPTKLMPWRNSHWRVPNFIGHPQAIKHDSGPGSTFPAKLDENNVSVTPTIHGNPQNHAHSDPTGDTSCKMMDRQPDVGRNAMIMPMPMSMPMPIQASIPISVQQGDVDFSQPTVQGLLSDAQLADCPITDDANPQEELAIEGGTISISSVYSQGLLNTLTQALQNAGVDLTQATISVQVDLGKRANRELASGLPVAKDHEAPNSSHQPAGRFHDSSNGENPDQGQKRMKK